MGGKTVKNILLGLAACLCMVALGWVAAKIAGPPAADSAAQESQAPTRGFFAKFFDRSKRFDLSGLKAWEGKHPVDAINGQTLFDHPEFKAALKETLGEELYKIFEHEAHHGEKFIGTPFKRDGQVLRMEATAHIGTPPFDVIIFMNTDEGFIDVFWSELIGGKDDSTRMHLHNGTSFPVDFSAISLSHKQLASAEAYAAYYREQQSKFLGTWSNTFGVQNGRNQITITRTIMVSGDPAKPNGLTFKQNEDVQIFNGVTAPKKLQKQYEGTVEVEDDVASFYSAADTRLGRKFPMLRYSYDHGTLVYHGANCKGSAKDGLCEPLRKVE